MGGNDDYLVPLEAKIKDNVEFVSISRSIMEDIYNIIAGSGFALFLSDRDGYILEVSGDGRIKAEGYITKKIALDDIVEEGFGTLTGSYCLL
ncbi:hypothetical protein [Clostridium tagluense]|uniref:hypothetical protein n=1 Tax=Clostridium tagluense TaxID=360422 RepID=UPI001C0DF895|nr:hypothetical protein [Clostridium tagluense]MBU3129865.1 hypothetical protein [Clostridium tagluense]